MKPQFLPRATAGVCALLLAGGAGLAVSQARSDNALPSNGTAQQQQGGMPGGPGGQGGGGPMGLSSLADALGVSEAKLESAMESLRSSMQPGQGGPDEMAAQLADALGLSESEVAAALEASRPDDGGMGAPPTGGAPPSATPDGSSDGSATGAVTS